MDRSMTQDERRAVAIANEKATQPVDQKSNAKGGKDKIIYQITRQRSRQPATGASITL